MIYFDNSATTYPKPWNVIRGTNYALKHLSFNSGRGGYRESIRAAEKIYDVREKVADMFGYSPENIIFTKNCTEALNTAIRGSVKSGDHIIISDLEHNSVTRVAESLSSEGIIEYDTAEFSYDDDEVANNFAELIRDNTTAIVCTHSSNVFGVCMPTKKIGRLCRERNIRFIVDGAQGAGTADINAVRNGIDILCMPGHKGLFGNMGTGIMAIGDGIDMTPLLYGGTGSNSLDTVQPQHSPDRYEAGTLNNPGIISIGEGIDYINAIGRDKIYRHEMEYARYIYDKLSVTDGIELYTPKPEMSKSMPIISFNRKGYSSEKTAAILAENGICVRGGYHCSPLAHRHFGTIETGTVRVSPGCFNTEKDCTRLISVIKSL